jgi:hypothetical protein
VGANSFSHGGGLSMKVFSGRWKMDQALADYERRRNEDALPMFKRTTQLEKLEPSPPEMLRLLNALRVNQEETGRFLGTVTGTVSILEFYSAENINRVIEASALKPAA